NSDGYSDRIYVGDMDGQVWRIDFDIDGNTGASDFATGGVIADLASTASWGERRKFYYPPVPALFSDAELGNFIALGIGSGHRANPLGTTGKLIDDRFYMIKDHDVFTVPTTYTAITESDLLDVTATLQPTTANLLANEGWMIDLRENEKIITKALALDNRFFFNSYIPGSSGDVTCDPAGGVGQGRSWIVGIGTGTNARNGEPIDEDGDGDWDFVEDGDSVCSHRCAETNSPFPPEPIMVFVEPDTEEGATCDGMAQVATVIGSEVINPDLCTKPVQTYWRQLEPTDPLTTTIWDEDVPSL
ncbi:MAG: hypothetical protein HKM24_05385, partial [Gammaproteobacteria bacterium]|nr:hypothetical protein [Gammaproteobacteria bacterium]